MSIAAIIVTYYPQEALLRRVIENLIPQVHQIYLIDNTPRNSNEAILTWLNVAWLESFGSKIDFRPLGRNCGIAKAQNIGIELATKAPHEELLFFDQDSFPPPNLVAGLLEARMHVQRSGVEVGVIGPAILDEKSHAFLPIFQAGRFWVKGMHYPRTWKRPIQTEFTISSGSLISAKVIGMVGPMLDLLFIDWVDVEWGLRAQALGFKNFVAPSVVMRHSIGDDYVRAGNKLIHLHSTVRNYFNVRNACYLVWYKSFPLAWRLTVALKIPLYVVFFSATAPRAKWRAFKILCLAVYQGFTRQMGPAPQGIF
jgi:rhamnosyltransferase